ncbi:hypothetical protein GCM10023108_42940 [Saccharopolyspora hordei]
MRTAWASSRDTWHNAVSSPVLPRTATIGEELMPPPKRRPRETTLGKIALEPLLLNG